MQNKLKERQGKTQFEIFSADLMMDTNHRIWLIEFNFSPVLYDPDFYTPGLRRYHERYHVQHDTTIDDRRI